MSKTMKPTIGTIRDVLWRSDVHGLDRVALHDAIDELAALRESDAALRARVETLQQQFAQAEVDAGEAHEKAEGARILAAGLEEQVQALTKERDAALNDLKALNEPLLRNIEIGPGSIEMAVESATGVVQRMAYAMAMTMDGIGAKNFLQQEMSIGTRDFVLLVQRRSGKTPFQMKAEAEAEREQLRAELDAAKADAARLREEMERAQLLLTWEDDARHWEQLHVSVMNGDSGLECAGCGHLTANGRCAACMRGDTPMDITNRENIELRRRVGLHEVRSSALQQQLAAATNDAARAELRARDLHRALLQVTEAHDEGFSVDDVESNESDFDGDVESFQRALDGVKAIASARAALAAAPDSTERLRALIGDAIQYGELRVVDDLDDAIDEVLRGGA